MPRLAATAAFALALAVPAYAAATATPIIASAPSGVTTDETPTFAFAAKGPARCRIDSQPWRSCTSPYPGLTLVTGTHSFSVRSHGSHAARAQWTLAAACDPPFGAFGPGNWPAACWRPYSQSSPFNQRLPAHPRLSHASSAVVRRLSGWGPPSSYSAGEQDGPADFAHPTYWSKVTDPRFRVVCDHCPIDGFRIRIPIDARPAAGSDHHMTIVAQWANREYDLWEARIDDRRAVVRVGGGGRISIDGSGLGSDATAGHFGNLAGIIRAQELEAGEINHALFMVVHCDSAKTVFPATGRAFPCSAEGRSERNAPPLGARFQLAMSDAQIRALELPPWKQAIYMAMAHYGLIVGDTGGGSSWSIQFESDSTYTSYGAPPQMAQFASQHPGDGYDGWRDDGDGRYTFQLDDPRIDWGRRLRVIAPCVSAARC
jgi:hypothetical protein